MVPNLALGRRFLRATFALALARTADLLVLAAVRAILCLSGREQTRTLDAQITLVRLNLVLQVVKSGKHPVVTVYLRAEIINLLLIVSYLQAGAEIRCWCDCLNASQVVAARFRESRNFV